MNYKTYEVRVYDNSDEQWYLNGKRHRENGPAVLRQSGYKAWYLNDELVTEAEYKQRTQTQMNIFVALHNKLKQENVI